MRHTIAAVVASILLVAPLAAGDAPYQRAQYRHWITSTAKACWTVRTEVLVRDAHAVQFRDAAGCTIAAGRWVDPYTGAVLTDPKRLDVDHLVPLQHAHAHGGAAWPPEKKRQYANDVSYPRHLLAVGAAANRQKGAKGPDAWRPAAREFWCEYATAWAVVKFRYELSASAAERAAVDAMLATCRPVGGGSDD